MTEKELQIYEDLDEISVELDRLSRRVERIAERISGQPGPRAAKAKVAQNTPTNTRQAGDDTQTPRDSLCRRCKHAERCSGSLISCIKFEERGASA